MLVPVILGQVLGNQPLAVFLRLLSGMYIGNQPLAVFLRLLSGMYIGNQPLAVIRIIRVACDCRRMLGCRCL